jgi:hypothetical protein
MFGFFSTREETGEAQVKHKQPFRGTFRDAPLSMAYDNQFYIGFALR